MLGLFILAYTGHKTSRKIILGFMYLELKNDVGRH